MRCSLHCVAVFSSLKLHFPHGQARWTCFSLLDSHPCVLGGKWFLSDDFFQFSYWVFVFTVDLLVYSPCWVCGFQLVPPNVYLSMTYKSRVISKVRFINFPFPGLHLHCQVWHLCQALDSKQFLLRFSWKPHGSLLYLSPWPILRSCLYAVWGCAKVVLKPPPLLAPLSVEGCPSSTGHSCTFVQAARLICEDLFWALLCPVLCCLSLADSDLAIWLCLYAEGWNCNAFLLFLFS